MSTRMINDKHAVLFTFDHRSRTYYRKRVPASPLPARIPEDLEFKRTPSVARTVSQQAVKL